jgi:hypothetical protein
MLFAVRAIAFEVLKGTGFNPYIHALKKKVALAPEGINCISASLFF